jgi:hypothetical protein
MLFHVRQSQGRHYCVCPSDPQTIHESLQLLRSAKHRDQSRVPDPALNVPHENGVDVNGVQSCVGPQTRQDLSGYGTSTNTQFDYHLDAVEIDESKKRLSQVPGTGK